ncbi:hypothetical protein ACU686_32795 [Yinghuangia aomiensis]
MTATLIDAEAERAEQAAAERDVLFADELLPGVGGQQMTLREGLAAGGSATFFTLMLLSSFDELEQATLGVLAPDIRDSFGMSDGAIVFLSAASGAFLVLGALPMGWLAGLVTGAAGWPGGQELAFSAFMVASGAAPRTCSRCSLARLGVGVAGQVEHLAGARVVERRHVPDRGARPGSRRPTASRAGWPRCLSPLAVGGIAALAGGGDGWRWAFFVLAVPTAVAALFAFRLPDRRAGSTR